MTLSDLVDDYARIIRNCVVCVRDKARVGNQIMGELPPRVSPSRPFSHMRMDYAGPFLVRSSSGRGSKSHKAWIVVFVCFDVKAIHLELVDDYTSAAFLAAFRRFTSRRSLPTDLYSDNGTNFREADRELSHTFRLVMKDPVAATVLAVSAVPAASAYTAALAVLTALTTASSSRLIDIKTMDFQKVNATGRMERFLPTKPLSELTVNELYNVTKINKVQTKYGSRIVVDLDATFTTFLPARFSKLFEDDPTSFTMMEEAVQSEKLRLKYIDGFHFYNVQVVNSKHKVVQKGKLLVEHLPPEEL
ncbi:uncharacterized protein LOC122510922 [Leptopilina heterotoma]|uniref:uncharacterized protein LOC122510922 n=1 Tax=Leptopilina heterotoma TaxID=63436 RepID=UPI001CA8298C|nr:uncharacterized protein LOC122510922 [Leptopilina heterotoma]